MSSSTPTPTILAVSISPTYTLCKPNVEAGTLVAGHGFLGDAHAGTTVKHRSRVARDPNQPNLRQVHLMHQELFEELASKGLQVAPGQMGENITTKGIPLLHLPKGTLLRLGQDAVIEVTGLRNPCHQLDSIAPGLMQAVLDRDDEGNIIRKAGIMAIVLSGGTVRPGDSIQVTLPHQPHLPLLPV